MHNSIRKVGVLAITLMVFALVFSLPVMAQNRIIKGKVTNDKGEPIVGAQILIQGMDVKREYPTKTDKKGEYFYMGIPYGQYRVVCRAQGYQPDVMQGIQPSISEERVVDFKLNPGQDRKLSFEMSAQEIEKLKQEQAKAEKQKAAGAEVKAAFDNGLKLAQEGKYAEATVEYKKALEKDPEQPYVLANMADAMSKNNQNEEALAAYQKAIGLKPDDAAMYTNMGVLLGKMGKVTESQEAFKKAASVNPGAAGQNFYNLGATLVNSGKTAEAAEAFKQAIAADPNFAEAYYQLGLCLSGTPNTIPDAIKSLQKYVQIGQKADQVEVAKQLIAVLQQKK
ncbi:MAG TPA: tetratricopeptide repeat protein [Acidobacteriota bacterium]|nr:tetratricopeptide repeat protein [Acidobacteriota bacterium]